MSGDEEELSDLQAYVIATFIVLFCYGLYKCLKSCNRVPDGFERKMTDLHEKFVREENETEGGEADDDYERQYEWDMTLINLINVKLTSFQE